IKCLDISHSPSDSLDDNEYSHESENDDLELNNIKSPNIFFNISSRAPLHPDVDLDTAFEDDILLQDEEVLIRSPTSHINISSRAPLHPDVDLDTAFEDDILLQDEELLINKRKRKFEDLPEQKEKPTKIRKLWNFMKYPFQKITSFSTSISENEPNISNFSLNNSEADGENEDTSTNETSQKYCKIM
ncbi:MATH and LRR domain-containing protein PFE0570w-like isoform X2, partial [Aphis craccivora]